MADRRQIRATFDRDRITVYQAYPARIADPALKKGTFVPPFSFRRMTWIKPSLLWLMTRSNWGQKPGQERILAVKMRRLHFDQLLKQGVLTAYEPSNHRSFGQWEDAFAATKVHIQWDPERSLRGAIVDYESLQVGISRHLIQGWVDAIVGLEDLTPLVRKIRRLRDEGKTAAAKRLLPKERLYGVDSAVMRRLGM